MLRNLNKGDIKMKKVVSIVLAIVILCLGTISVNAVSMADGKDALCAQFGAGKARK